MAIGYIYKHFKKMGQFDGALVGQTISNPDYEPPWIVVFHDIDDINVANWPGHLWRAEIIEAIDPQNHRGNYTICRSVRLIEEVKTDILFWTHGAKIEDILRYSAALTLPVATALAPYHTDQVKSIESDAWHRWLEHTQSTPYSDRKMNGVVAAGNGSKRSPIGHGLSLIHRLGSDAARREMGDAAFEEDEDGIWLLQPWSSAISVLCAAAWGLGAPDFLEENEIPSLITGWNNRPSIEGKNE